MRRAAAKGRQGGDAKAAGTPVLYERIARELGAQIRARKLPPFAKLPSESELMADYAVSRVTVRQALRRLAEAGLVISRQGKGVFVAGVVVNQALSALRGFHESLVMQGHDPVTTLLAFERHRPAVKAPGAAPFEADIYRFRRLYRLADLPIAVADVSLPGHGQAITREDVERLPVYSLLREVVKRPVARASVQVRASASDPEIAKLLKLAPGTAILVMERTSYDPDGLAAETTRFAIPSEVFAFQMEVAGPLQIAPALKRILPDAAKTASPVPARARKSPGAPNR